MCQDIFETELALKPTSDAAELSPFEVQDQIAKLKKKILGNVQFIGELYKVKILNQKILLACIHELLLEQEGNINEDKLEGAIILLRTCGDKLEQKSVINQTNAAFDKLDNFKERVSLRLKFLIMNLQDLRGCLWTEVVDGPKHVEAVREEFKRDQERARG
jgi:translation initiation factor 4G